MISVRILAFKHPWLHLVNYWSTRHQSIRWPQGTNCTYRCWISFSCHVCFFWQISVMRNQNNKRHWGYNYRKYTGQSRPPNFMDYNKYWSMNATFPGLVECNASYMNTYFFLLTLGILGSINKTLLLACSYCCQNIQISLRCHQYKKKIFKEMSFIKLKLTLYLQILKIPPRHHHCLNSPQI